MPANVLVTGASGFVGQGLTAELTRRGRPWVGLARTARGSVAAGPELGPDADFAPWLQGVSVVVHLAARVPALREVRGAEAGYDVANVQGTLRLAEQAVAAGVRRFVFLSSIKVLGDLTLPGCPFTTDSPVAPTDAYGRSKARAEQQLRALAEQSGMELVIVRPPLVYGPGVKGNFAQLAQWVRRGWPLPLGGIHNRRSLVARANLVDLIIKTLDHPAAPERPWLVSDGQDLSLPELLLALGQAQGVRVWMPRVPEGALQALGRLAGRRDVVDRLCGSLCVDTTDTCERLDWKPVQTADAAIREAVAGLGPPTKEQTP